MIAAVKRQFSEKGALKIVAVLGAVIGVIYIASIAFSQKDAMTTNSANTNNNNRAPAPSAAPMPLQSTEYASANSNISASQIPSACNKMTQNPAELLPTDNNNEWAQLNPAGRGELSNVNLLKAGHNIGINTIGQSMRNANLQVRSEPANPQVNTGPWNKSTIEHDAMRPSFEIGQGSA
jgi:hypothetical protein